MRSVHGWSTAFIAGFVLAWSAGARAEPGGAYPAAMAERPITLREGMAEVDLSPVSDLSAGHSGDSVYLLPALRYGVTDALELVVFSPAGFCLKEAGGGCRRGFDGLGAELVGSLRRGGASEIALHGTVASLLHDPALAAASAGVRAKVHRERAALVFDASLQVGLSDRDLGNRDLVALSADFQVQVLRELALLLDTAVFTPFDTQHGGGATEILVPLAAGLTYTPVPRLDVGARFAFLNLLGNHGSADARTASLLLAVRM
jgi:hypothetical protein